MTATQLAATRQPHQLRKPTSRTDAVKVAARLHDDWRFARSKLPEGQYDKEKFPDGKWEPRVKIVEGKEYDIANLHFDYLPPKFQTENMAAAKVATAVTMLAETHDGSPCVARTCAAASSPHAVAFDARAATARAVGNLG